MGYINIDSFKAEDTGSNSANDTTKTSGLTSTYGDLKTAPVFKVVNQDTAPTVTLGEAKYELYNDTTDDVVAKGYVRTPEKGLSGESIVLSTIGDATDGSGQVLTINGVAYELDSNGDYLPASGTPAEELAQDKDGWVITKLYEMGTDGREEDTLDGDASISFKYEAKHYHWTTNNSGDREFVESETGGTSSAVIDSIEWTVTKAELIVMTYFTETVNENSDDYEIDERLIEHKRVLGEVIKRINKVTQAINTNTALGATDVDALESTLHKLNVLAKAGDTDILRAIQAIQVVIRKYNKEVKNIITIVIDMAGNLSFIDGVSGKTIASANHTDTADNVVFGDGTSAASKTKVKMFFDDASDIPLVDTTNDTVQSMIDGRALDFVSNNPKVFVDLDSIDKEINGDGATVGFNFDVYNRHIHNSDVNNGAPHKMPLLANRLPSKLEDTKISTQLVLPIKPIEIELKQLYFNDYESDDASMIQATEKLEGSDDYAYLGEEGTAVGEGAGNNGAGNAVAS